MATETKTPTPKVETPAPFTPVWDPPDVKGWRNAHNGPFGLSMTPDGAVLVRVGNHLLRADTFQRVGQGYALNGPFHAFINEQADIVSVSDAQDKRTWQAERRAARAEKPAPRSNPRKAALLGLLAELMAD